MGRDREAVVDSELRVRGVDGLRIADASVMPTIPAANTNAPSIMIGEFASRLLTGVRTSRAVAVITAEIDPPVHQGPGVRVSRGGVPRPVSSSSVKGSASLRAMIRIERSFLM